MYELEVKKLEGYQDYKGIECIKVTSPEPLNGRVASSPFTPMDLFFFLQQWRIMEPQIVLKVINIHQRRYRDIAAKLEMHF